MKQNSKTSSSDQSGDLICVGVVTGVRGLKGDIRVKSFTANPKDVAAYGPVYDETGTQRFDIRITGQSKGALITRFSGIADRTAAEGLKGLKLFVPRDKLPKPEEDEFYFTDLIGLRAEQSDGEVLGTVRTVEDYGGGVFLEIAGGKHGLVLVPFTKAVVPEVNLTEGRVVIDPPDGLFETPEPEGPEADDPKADDKD